MLTNTELATKVKEEGGFSYSLSNGSEPKAGERKFAVAISKNFERKYSLSSFTPSTLVSYIAEFAGQLSKAGAHLGAWLEGDTVYLDVSVVLTDKSEAINIARANEQLAIFSFENMSSEPVLKLAA